MNTIRAIRPARGNAWTGIAGKPMTTGKGWAGGPGTDRAQTNPAAGPAVTGSTATVGTPS